MAAAPPWCGATASCRYWALDARSDAVARKLVEKGVGRGTLVGVYAPRGPETTAAIIGILKAGGTYLPFDPSHSAKTLRYICEDATPALMLVHEEQIRQSRQVQFWACPTVDIGPEARLETGRRSLPMPVINGEDLACLMYSFGSSGQPKGVQIPHRALLRLVQEGGVVAVGRDQVVMQVAPLACEAANFEIWSALCNGGKLAIVPAMNASTDSIADTIARHGVTTAWLGVGMFHQIIEQRPQSLLPVQQLLIGGGDVPSAYHVEKARQTLAGTKLIWVYGPSENTTVSCCYVVPADVPVTGPLPIGQPLAHTQALVLDDAKRPITDNREGELCVGGATLAHGYLNRPQLTAERFSHAAGMVQRLFRTGDRVRRREDGCYDLLSRADRQVKINGRRVELDAIEACLRRSGMVADAAVTTVGEVDQRRVAAFVTAPAGRAVSTGELRSYLHQELAEYMVPQVVQVLDVLPLTSSGNVDRAALAERVPAPPSSGTVRASTSSVEATLLRIWREVLGNDDVTVHDSFFDLGGSSLQLEQAHALIKSSLRSDIALMDLFTYPRVGALAAWINRSEKARREAALSKTGGWRQTMGFMRTKPVPAMGQAGATR